jgi:hypothetical protein
MRFAGPAATRLERNMGALSRGLQYEGGSMLSQVGALRLAAGDSHRFVVAKRLKYESHSNAASLLTLLLQHPSYRDTFLTQDPGWHGGATK